MIDVNDPEAMAQVKLVYQSGSLLMVGKAFRSKGGLRRPFVIVEGGDLNAAWRKLVEQENERTDYIDSIYARIVA